MTPTATARVDALLRDAAEARRVPGVVALAADRDGIFYHGAFGTRSLSEGVPMREDSVFWIASMTKAITAVAAMQLIEQGRMSLDQPAGELVAGLSAPQVLEGFDAAGQPMLRLARRAITLRHLLTHTAGFSYENWNANLLRYSEQTGLPGASSGLLAGLNSPLLAEPGERWDYSMSMEWVGRIIEAVSGQSLDTYMHDNIFAPLGMQDTSYLLRPDQERRLAKLHVRDDAGVLYPIERERLRDPEFFPGGGALHSTGPDYLKFLLMLLNGGRSDDAVLLQPATVALMAHNHIGDLAAGVLRTANPTMSNDLDLFPGTRNGWGLSFLINSQDTPTGRSAGSLAWAGMGNTYFWLDPKRGVTGLLLTQVRPFADTLVLRLFEEFETAIYDGYSK